MPIFCKNTLNLFLIILSLLCFKAVHAEEKKTLKVSIFASNNGAGLQHGQEVIKKSLTDLGYIVNSHTWKEKPNKSDFSDINIFFEYVNPKWFKHAKLNWFVPNPEWFIQELSVLDNINLILCRNHNVENIFQSLNKKTYYLGFSSLDNYKNDIPKDYSSFLHLVGRSIAKGTPAVIEAWKNDNSMPNLLVIIQKPETPLIQPNVHWIAERLPFEEVLNFQNSCGIHLCPSEVEGFGHYIMEAMATKAVVITTDAPPMNEFITDKRCLVPYTETIPVYLGIRYMADPAILKKTVMDMMLCSKEELMQIGEQNRERYLQLTREFHGNLKVLMQNAELELRFK